MSSQITFFRKSLCDFENPSIIATASEGQDAIANIFDRSNRTAWGTNGSLDANNTNFIVDFSDVNTIDTILLMNHNFKNYTLEWWDDINTIWVLFVTVTNNAQYFTAHKTFGTLNTSKIRVTIQGTQIANADKLLSQFIATTYLGQLVGWPVIAKPVLGRNLVKQTMLSGKEHVLQNIGFYSATLTVSQWRNVSDLTLIETLYNSSEGFLYWPSGGDEAQFFFAGQGYKAIDIFLCRFDNEYSPENAYGLYQAGRKMSINIHEVTT